MKIKIDSNFGLYGLPEESEIHLDGPRVTLRMLLEELAKRSSGRVNYINPLTGAVDPTDFILEINGISNSGSKRDLSVVLNDGDVLSIKITPLEGG